MLWLREKEDRLMLVMRWGLLWSFEERRTADTTVDDINPALPIIGEYIIFSHSLGSLR